MVLAGGGFAAAQFFAGSPDTLAERVPGNAVTYLHVNIDPAGSQKLGLLSLVDRINDAADEDLISFEMFESQMGAETDISFEEDIRPWLGTQAAAFVSSFPLPQSFETPDLALLVDVTDAEAASAFVESQGTFEAWDAGDGRQGWILEEGEPNAVAVIDDGVLFGGTEAAVRAALGADGTLADNEAYSASIDQLPDRVLTGWVNAEAFVGALGSEAEPFAEQLSDVGQTAFSLSFTDGAVEFTSVQNGQAGQQVDASAMAPLGSLPAGGLLYGRTPAVGQSIQALVDGIDAQEQALAEEFGDSDFPLPSEEIDQGLMEIGTSLAELTGLIGDLTFAVGYDASQPTDNVRGLLQVAVTDEARAAELLDTIAEDIPSDSGITVAPGSIAAGQASVSVEGGQLAIRAGTFGEGTLADDERYQTAIADAQGEPLFYIDMRGVAEQIGLFAGAEGTIQQEELQALNVFGAFDSVIVTAEVQDGLSRGSFRMLFQSEYTDVPLGDEANPPDLDLGELGNLAEIGTSGFDDAPASGFDDIDGFGDDPFLDDLYLACESGDGLACDDLWFSSPIGSQYESFADTCGFAQPEGSAGSCEELLGQ